MIAASATGKKYEHAINWGLKVVALEWFEQSVERGMILGEEHYNPTTPVGERGIGAWERLQKTSPVLGKRMRDTVPSNPVNTLRRKLRRSASARVGSQSDALWANITAGGLEHRKAKTDDWNEAGIEEPQPPPIRTDQIAQVPEVTHTDAERSEDPASHTRRPFLDDEDGIFANRLVFIHGFDRKKVSLLHAMY